MSFDVPSDAETLVFRVEHSTVRLDRFVADALGCGRRRARCLIEGGAVFVDGHRARRSMSLVRGQCVGVIQPCRGELVEETKHPMWRVLYEDPHMLVIDKPAGVHTHMGKRQPSLAEQLLAAYPDLAVVAAPIREGSLVHRLDCDTSGVVIAARDSATYADLRSAFGNRRVVKRYLALVAGRVMSDFVVDTPLARRGRRVAVASARERRIEARTIVRVLETGAGWSLVEAETRTGAPHQVRVHLAHAGHPLIGDPLYGPTSVTGTRAGQLLHALSLSLPDGRTFSAPTPADFTASLARLRRRAAR